MAREWCGCSSVNTCPLRGFCPSCKRSAESPAGVKVHASQCPPVMKFRTAFFLILGIPLFFSPLIVRGETWTESGIPVEQVVRMVQNYIAAEQLSAEQRAESRSGMVEFSFRSSGQSGRDHVLSAKDWRKWEMERPVEVQTLEFIGEPRVQLVGKDLVRVYGAVYFKRLEGGEGLEGVSMRSFDVLIGDGEPRISHERLLAIRKGIRPGQWKQLRRTDNGARSNLRSSPTTERDNIVGKLNAGVSLDVWEQRDERWLFVRNRDGLTGFLHRSQIDFRVSSREGNTVASREEKNQISPGQHYLLGLPLPGRPGYILNPHTNTLVDVRGLRAGTLVRDPRDPVKGRVFRVPFEGNPGRGESIKEE